ncbi:MAG: hypothetical protein NVS3B24_22000 [Candidatus Dormibacteria bacterium]
MLAVVLSLGVAVLAALPYRATLGQINTVELFSSGVANLVARLAAALPLGYAFGAGMVSAVNPCGFALLPGYLGLFLGDRSGEGDGLSAAERVKRALLVGVTVTASFVLLFGVAGLALSLSGYVLIGAFPWIGLVIGMLLLLLGGFMLGGSHLYSSLGPRLAGRLGGRARQGGIGGYAAYGLAYGAASLGCTLPIFLAVVGSGLTAGGPLRGLGQFVLYALGMGFVLSILTLAAVGVKGTAFGAVRRMGAIVEPMSALLMVIVGAYVVYYWLSVGGVLAALGWRA